VAKAPCSVPGIVTFDVMHKKHVLRRPGTNGMCGMAWRAEPGEGKACWVGTWKEAFGVLIEWQGCCVGVVLLVSSFEEGFVKSCVRVWMRSLGGMKQGLDGLGVLSVWREGKRLKK
jgi:hypothetical protein